MQRGLWRLPEKDPALLQVLSLYLLLLAFFVVLFNTSRFDRGRIDAVGESLNNTFPSSGRPTDHLARLTTMLGPRLGDEAVLKKVGNLISTELEFAKIETRRPGRELLVRMPAENLFVGASDRVRADRGALLSGIARLLGEQAPGLQHKLEITLTSERIHTRELVKSVPLEVVRAASLAQEVLRRGAAHGSVSGGIRYGRPGSVILLFRVDPEPSTEKSGIEEQGPKASTSAPASRPFRGRS